MAATHGSFSADRLNAVNTDGGQHAVHGAQSASSGTGAAVHGVSDNSSAPVALFEGAGNLIQAKNAAGTQRFLVDNSGNVTVGGTVNGLSSPEPGPGLNSYLAWNFPVWHATSTFQTTSTNVYVMRFVAPSALTATNLDIWCTNLNGGTITHAYAAIYTMAGVQLSAAADIEAAFTGTGVQTWTLTTPQALTAGTAYYAAIEIADTSAAPTLLAAPTALGLNVNLATNVYNYATYSTSATIPSSITIASLSAATTTPVWIGVR